MEDLNKKRLMEWDSDPKVTRISIYTEEKVYHIYKEQNLMDEIDTRGRDITYTDPVIIIGENLVIASKLEDTGIDHVIRWNEIDNLVMKRKEEEK